jgi:hypothetical protein
MATSKREIVRGAPSLLAKDQWSFTDDEPRWRKHFTAGGRKVVDLAHVGVMSPDADADPPVVLRRRRPG